jgi:hypothetical protein
VTHNKKIKIKREQISAEFSHTPKHSIQRMSVTYFKLKDKELFADLFDVLAQRMGEELNDEEVA